MIDRRIRTVIGADARAAEIARRSIFKLSQYPTTSVPPETMNIAN